MRAGVGLFLLLGMPIGAAIGAVPASHKVIYQKP